MVRKRIENIISKNHIFRQVCENFTKVALLFFSPLTPYRTFSLRFGAHELTENYKTEDMHLKKIKAKGSQHVF